MEQEIKKNLVKPKDLAIYDPEITTVCKTIVTIIFYLKKNVLSLGKENEELLLFALNFYF